MFCGTGQFLMASIFFGSGLIPFSVSIIPKNGTDLQFILTFSGLRCRSISKHLSRNLMTLASCSFCVDPNTMMSSAMFVTPARPESKLHKAFSNKSPVLQSPIARTLTHKHLLVSTWLSTTWIWHLMVSRKFFLWHQIHSSIWHPLTGD